MRKKVFGYKLSRETDTRLALFRNLAKELILHGEIKTTKAKAKAFRPFIEKLITKAKENTVSARRKVFGLLGNDRRVSEKLLSLVSGLPEKGGFIKSLPLQTRRGDNALIVKLILPYREDRKSNKFKAISRKSQKELKSSDNVKNVQDDKEGLSKRA